ncbi:carboxylesterase/lipase family protein [Streptomyces sp. NPDC057702]|uniref:carboxylesterase/lipase family protein n=1 Tax=unclassified Streptomyces TaxID=2593676 RepID=UPI00368A5A13
MAVEPIVRVARGTVRGRVREGVAVFAGIPYAAGPTGAGRFAPPEVATWHGEWDARQPGPSAPQAGEPGQTPLQDLMGEGWLPGAEYLTATVWTPSPEPGARLPVLVYLHGGAYVGGRAATDLYDGTRFAADGVVQVGLNFRVGVAGYAYLPDAPANRGLLDQLAGLRWVRENVAAFGGDPDRVTVFGESAGASSVSALLAAAPRGLFRRAISASGSGARFLTPAQASLVTAALAEELGVAPTAAAFAPLPDRALVDALTRVAAAAPNLVVDGVRDPLMGLTPLGLVADGELVRDQSAEELCAGAAGELDLLLGHTTDEVNLFLFTRDTPPLTWDSLSSHVARLHPDPARVIAAYETAGRGATPTELFSAIGTDYLFAVPTIHLADAHARRPASTWRYEFAWRSPGHKGRLGACHGLDLPFAFATLTRAHLPALGFAPDTEETRTLTRRTHAAWLSFITTGTPGWPPYTPAHPTVQRLDSAWQTTLSADGPERGVWAGVW